MILKPEALDELMAKEATDYSDEEIKSLIAHFREQRKAFIVAEATGKTKKPAKAADSVVTSLIEDLI